ncbi:MAG: hypothetical protein MUD10_04920 [Candidatus Pacebacteria bacterium]|jgi:hypothetical protein|nr:hypothetical protein [Candidatus Paceibacterota bacterium]
MKIFRKLKYIIIGAIVFFAQNVWAEQTVPLYGAPIDRGVHYRLPSAQVLATQIVPLLFVLILLSGIISPILGYRWYIKHGGTKKWLRYVAYAPLILVVIAIGVILVAAVGINFQ